ncbi:MAG: HAMP domain-containing sensor histidine kinase [Anaeromyxobacter sp.]
MNLVPAVSLAAASVGLHSAVVWSRLAKAPGWRHQRWFGAAGFAGSAYALCGAVVDAGVTEALVPRIVALQVALAIGTVVAWQCYADGFAGGRPPAPIRMVRMAYAALALVPLAAPGAVVDTADVHVHVVWPGLLEYRSIGWTPLGMGIAGAAILGVVSPAVRFLQAWRRGVPFAGMQFLALASMVPIAVNDVLASDGVYGGPLLLEVGMVLPITVVALAGTARFVREARELDRLRGDLERAVAERTTKLVQVQDALNGSERLAALGQFAGGIAHEVNNPAAAVSVNLRYIREHADEGPNRDEIREAAAEGILAIDRIVALVKRLSEAGRLAGRPRDGASCEVAQPIVRAVEDVSGRWPDGRVAFRLTPLPGVRVSAPDPDIHHAVQALLVNAAEAVPEGREGSVQVSVVVAEGRVSVAVEDDGVGLGPDAARRAFEPFFSTKPPGRGPGLGLTLARAFARRYGGDVQLEPREGGGTRALLSLPIAAAEANGSSRSAA